MLKIIIDNDIILSHLMTKKENIVDQIIKLHTADQIEVYSSSATLDELKTALQYPKIKSRIFPNKTSQFLAWYKYNLKLIEVKIKLTICRDPKDNKFLELATEVKADYLITGDQDLLVLEKLNTTKILKPSEGLAETKLNL